MKAEKGKFVSYQPYPGGSYPPGGQQPGSQQFGGQPPGYSSSGFQYGQPPQKKKPIWPWFLGGAIFLLLLLLGGCFYVGTGFVSSPFVAASDFAIELEDGDYAASYDGLCVASKSQISFDKYLVNYVPEKEIEIIDIAGQASLQDSGDKVSDSFIGEFNYVDGTREDLFYDLVKESGDWKVCNPPRPAN